MIQTINTKNKKTAIFALLALKASINLFEAPMYLANFNILNILNNLSALKATKPCEPAKKNYM